MIPRPWRKTGKNINCKFCNKKLYIPKSINYRKYCSKHCYSLYMINSGIYRGENNHNWKGDNITYGNIHVWLRKSFGNPISCKKCKKIGDRKSGRWNIEWALLKDKKYQRKRENYIGLCISCHRRYDFTEVSRQKMSLAKMGYTPWNKGKAGLQIAWNKGLKMKELIKA